MLIQCPKCQRRGDIPDRFGLTPHSVRCRTCRTQFMTVPLSAPEAGDHPTMLNSVNSTDERAFVDISRQRSFRDGPAVEIASAVDARGPGDSHYEWPAVDGVDVDDSQVEVPAFAAEVDESSDDIPVLAAESPSGEIVIGEPTSHGSAAIWARSPFAPAVLIRSLSLAILGFFVLQAVLNAGTVSAAVLAFIAGAVGLASLLLLSREHRPDPRLLGEFTKNLTQAGSRTDLDRSIVRDRSVAH